MGDGGGKCKRCVAGLTGRESGPLRCPAASDS